MLVSEKTFDHPPETMDTIEELLSKVQSALVNPSKDDYRILRSLIHRFSVLTGFGFFDDSNDP